MWAFQVAAFTYCTATPSPAVFRSVSLFLPPSSPLLLLPLPLQPPPLQSRGLLRSTCPALSRHTAFPSHEGGPHTDCSGPGWATDLSQASQDISMVAEPVQAIAVGISDVTSISSKENPRELTCGAKMSAQLCRGKPR